MNIHLTNKNHIFEIVKKVRRQLNPLKAICRKLNSKDIEKMYTSFIRPHFDYIDVLYNSSAEKFLTLIDRCHYSAALLCTGCHGTSNTSKVLNILNWMTMSDRRLLHCNSFMYKIISNAVPSYISDITNQFLNQAQRHTRHANIYQTPIRCSVRFRKSPIPNAITVWNKLPTDVKKAKSLTNLKKLLKRHYNQNDAIISTTTLNLNRSQELYLNRARVDLLFKARLYSHHCFGLMSPNCHCGKAEAIKHFFFQCRETVNVRIQFLDEITLNFTHFNKLKTINEKLNFLLHGNEDLSLNDLNKLFAIVTDFIHEHRS